MLEECRIHELKILPQFYIDVKNGIKDFEIRRNDRDFKVGDIVVLNEWSNGKYTGQRIRRRIKYIYHGDDAFGIAEGYCVMGFADPRAAVTD